MILIEPESFGVNLFDYTKMPLLGLPILGTILKQMGIKVKIFCENISSINWQEIKKADLVGITVLTSLAPRAYELAAKIKKINSKCRIMMGGPHVSFCPQEALKNGADFVIRHEGEKTLKKLINCLRDEGNPGDIKGLSYKKNNKIRHNPDRNNYQNLNQLPTPDFSLIKNYEKLKFIPLQTSRGCPHNCDFCSVVQMFGQKIRHRSPDRVIRDLNKMNNYFDLENKHVFFVDDNFSANKKRTEILLQRMKMFNYDFEWSTQEEINIYKKENILNLMKETGCKRLYIGIESFNPSSLKEYKKPQDVNDISTAIEVIQKKDILIHGMFVLGADNDSKDSILQTVKTAAKKRIDTAQFFVLVPLPGTKVYQRLKKQGRLLVDKMKGWELFGGQHVVFKPQNLSPYELQKLQIKAFKKFYNLKNSLGWLKKRKFNNLMYAIYGRISLRKWKNHNHRFLNILKKRYS